MGPIQNLPEILSLLRRRAPLIIVMLALGVLFGIASALRSERVYSATSVIQVINPVIMDESAASPTSVTRRIQTIEQQLMSRENLLAMAERYGIFQGRDINVNEQVAVMRQSISIEVVAAAHPGTARDGALSALLITASAADAETAAAISNELSQSILSQSALSRQDNAQQALRFFEQEEARLQQAIDLLDTRIALFQAANEGLMPGALALRRDDLRRLEDSRLEIERELVQLRSELASLDATSRRTVTLRRIEQLNDEIARRTEENALVSARIDAIHALMAQAPEIERELNAMERSMTQLQTQLTSAAERRREAEVGLRIEDDQQSDRFVLLESALPPEYPVSTSRKRIAGFWAVAGLFMGLAVAYGLEWIHPALRTASRMERELQLRPLISIPHAVPASDIRRQRVFLALAIGLLLISLALGVAQML